MFFRLSHDNYNTTKITLHLTQRNSHFCFVFYLGAFPMREKIGRKSNNKIEVRNNKTLQEKFVGRGSN